MVNYNSSEDFMPLKKSYVAVFGMIVLVGFSILVTNGWAQKKKLSYKQVFQRGEPQLLGSLPRIQGWLDDDHYLELRSGEADEEGSSKLMKINAAQRSEPNDI